MRTTSTQINAGVHVRDQPTTGCSVLSVAGNNITAHRWGDWQRQTSAAANKMIHACAGPAQQRQIHSASGAR